MSTKALQPIVEVDDTRFIAVIGDFHPEFKGLDITPRYSAWIDPNGYVVVESRTTNCCFVEVLGRFIVDGSRSAEDSNLTSLYEAAVDLEAYFGRYYDERAEGHGCRKVLS